MLRLTVLFLIGGALCAAEHVQDIYQKNVAPELVKKVDLAKEKQVDGADLKQAESLLSDVLKQKPDYYRALYNLGQVYESEGDHEKAINTLKEAEAVRNKEGIRDNSILNSLGWAYLTAGDLDRAEDYLKKAYDTRDNTASTNERVLNNLGFLYLQKGQTVEARKYLTEAKDQFQSATAVNLLKSVNDYERLQNKSQPSGQMWAVYGEQPKAGGEWIERHFDVQGDSKTSVPKPNDTVIAVDNVYIRNSKPVLDNETQDVIVGPIIGYIKPGDRVLVLQLLDSNSPTDENAYYFIRVLRLSKE
jgi:tetratricopeptide (TPR) repeat protein